MHNAGWPSCVADKLHQKASQRLLDNMTLMPTAPHSLRSGCKTPFNMPLVNGQLGSASMVDLILCVHQQQDDQSNSWQACVQLCTATHGLWKDTPMHEPMNLC